MKIQSESIEIDQQIPEIKSQPDQLSNDLAKELITQEIPEDKDASSIQASVECSQEGDEKLIFEQEYTKTPQVIIASNFINQKLTFMTIVSVEFFTVGLVLNLIFVSKKPDFSYLFCFLSCTSATKCLFYCFFASIDPLNHINHIKTMWDQIVTVFIYHGFYFYLAGVYSPQLLLATCFGSIGVSFVKMVIFRKQEASHAFNVLILFELSLYTLLALKFVFPEDDAIWIALQIFGTSVFYAVIYFTTALSFFLLIYLGYVLYKFNALNENEIGGLVQLLGFWFLSTSMGIVINLGLIGLRPMLEANQIKPLASVVSHIPDQIYFCGIVSYFASFFLITMVLFIHLKIKDLLLRRISNSNPKKIFLKIYSQSFTMNVVNISGIFFKKLNGRKSRKMNETTGQEFEDCVICQNQKSSFLFLPCNHCVTCDECIRTFVELNERCPICKTEISRGLHLNYDHKKLEFKVDQAYKINSKGK